MTGASPACDPGDLKRTPFFLAAAAAAASALVASGGAAGLPALATVTADPFSNPTSQHRTAVEPDSFAWGSTIVEAAQVGRFFGGGASNIGWGTSVDGGKTWRRGTLPGITKVRSGPYARVSDPSVAYDARHSVWLISSLAVDETSSGLTSPAVLVSRSTDAIHWTRPVVTAAVGRDMDKNWIVCDNWSKSAYYGHCYVEWDDAARSGGLLQFNTSSNGGKTWSTSRATADSATGIGGQPLVRPSGTVVVPYLNEPGSALRWTTSTNGGSSWTASKQAAAVHSHADAADLRSAPLPSAEIDRGGRVYMVWQDCRFRAGCASNDIVLSTLGPAASSWTAPKRIPIDPASSSVDHFIPGIGVDPATSGATAHLALAYYFYSSTNCTFDTCRLRAGFISSVNGGSSWRGLRSLTSPSRMEWLPDTSLGPMVGDYISTSFAAGKAFPFISVPRRPGSSADFNQVIQTTSPGLAP